MTITRKDRLACLLILVNASLGKMKLSEAYDKYGFTKSKFAKVQAVIKEDPTMQEQVIILALEKFLKMKESIGKKYLVSLDKQYKAEKKKTKK